MTTLQYLASNWVQIVVGFCAIVGAVSLILSTVGALLPADSSAAEWCKRGATDALWLRDKIASILSTIRPPTPPAGPTALLVLGALVALLAGCTPREIAKTTVDVTVAACQVASADMQDEPEWLKLICQVAGEVQPFLVKLPRSSPEAQRLLEGAR